MSNHRHINHNDMRNRNLALILNHLHQNSPISRAQLSKQLGINKASISVTIRDLIRQGIVVEKGIKEGVADVGHPSIDLMINPDAGRLVGVEAQPDRIRTVVTDVAPGILWRSEISIQFGTPESDYFAALKDAINQAIEVAEKDGLPVLGVGLALPGLVDIDNNVLLAAYQLGWKNIDLNSLMSDHPSVRFFAGNEAHISALGESYYGNTRNSVSSLYIHWGHELSGGIIINDDVVPGALGLAGDLGHISLDPAGRLCTCGNRGCWNDLTNCSSFLSSILQKESTNKNNSQQNPIEGLDLEDAFRRAKADDPATVQALRESAQWMGKGIANMINLLNPEWVIIGGPMSAVFELVLPAIEKEVNQRTLPWQRESCRIKQAFYQQDACLFGTVATVIWNIINNPLLNQKKSIT